MRDLNNIGMEIHNCWDRKLEKPVWVVNNNGDLGVYVNNQYYFLYKGDSLVYENEYDSNGDKKFRMRVRRVEKREFGESCNPVKFVKDEELFEEFRKNEFTEGEGWIDLPVLQNRHQDGCDIVEGTLPSNFKYCPHCGARLKRHLEILEYYEGKES